VADAAPASHQVVTARPAVFLDRDGVLNAPVMRDGVARSPRSLSELKVVDGAREVLTPLRDRFALVIVSNQPEITRGTIREEAVEAIHRVLREQLGIEAAYFCPHDNADACSCRKPAPGMLERAARDLDLDLDASWMIGDRWVDVAAAIAAGVRAVLLDHPGAWSPTSAGAPPDGLRDLIIGEATTLSGCVDIIVRTEGAARPQR
jgi:D-glycero-D-manno-heptose 1,7-bisphosphate phosphatase